MPIIQYLFQNGRVSHHVLIIIEKICISLNRDSHHENISAEIPSLIMMFSNPQIIPVNIHKMFVPIETKKGGIEEHFRFVFFLQIFKNWYIYSKCSFLEQYQVPVHTSHQMMNIDKTNSHIPP